MLKRDKAESADKKAERPRDDTGILQPTLRYPKPKIVLIDMKDDSMSVLTFAGYNVATGTFGSCYNVTERSDQYQIVREHYDVPNYAEQEVVVIDLAPGPIKEGASDLDAIMGNYYYWAKCNRGVIDSRPAAMGRFRDAFDRILDHGGVFIVFADDPVTADVVFAKRSAKYIEPGGVTYGLWSFLSIFDDSIFTTNRLRGSEMVSELDAAKPFGRLLLRHLSEANYTCTLEPKETGFNRNYGLFHNDRFKSWMPLVNNKFGSPVAGVFLPHGKTKGVVLVFPQVSNKSKLLLELFREVLPELVADVFPYAEPGHWKNNDEYQLPAIIRAKHLIDTIEQETKHKIAEIHSDIARLRSETSYLIELLTETGDNLVKAVKKSLEVLGFASVVDVDEEIKGTSKGEMKREDLRIDEEGTLLIEVKGIAGMPSDADALQVQKYVVVRMREWDRTNVHGLEIINHQKAVPPLDRDHAQPFRGDIIVNAEHQQFGLMTTWDLYRLVRSFLANGWKAEHLKPVFFKFGRVEPVPIHYQLIGVVEHYWEKPGAVSIELQSAGISVNDRIAFELPTHFEEQEIGSLQIEGEAVETANAPLVVGLKTRIDKKQLKPGVRVFKIATNL
jgi:hypothetical protein